MFGRLGGCQGDSPQAEQFEQRRGLSVKGAQLPLGPGQVDAAESREDRGERKKEVRRRFVEVGRSKSSALVSETLDFNKLTQKGIIF